VEKNNNNNKSSSMKTNKKNYCTFFFGNTLTFIRVSLLTLVSIMSSASVSALTITAEMSPEITAEYDKQLALQNWPQMHTKLSLMDNPYKNIAKKIKKQLKSEAPEGKRRRLMTDEESMIMAKKKRFDYCQASVEFFVSFADRSFTLSRVENNPLTKDKLMTGNGVKYPFTKEETNNAGTRPAQIALDLGWKHQGKGPMYAEAFLATCLAIPIALYSK
jgi:hypothetical protein